MKRQLAKIAAAFLVLVSTHSTATHAQSQNLTVLHTFTSSPDGNFPIAGPQIDAAGNLYGTTFGGGPLGGGTLWKLDSASNETVLASGLGEPFAPVVRDTAGNLYGTSRDGGAFGNGTVFKLDSSGHLTVLHSFVCTEGANPFAGVVIDAAGNLYGTTTAALSCGVLGTVFKIDPAGNFTILHFFTGSDGCCSTSGVIMDAAGNLYGTGGGGGAFGQGVVFKLDPSGNETVLHSFTGVDGASPGGGLIMDAAGNLYGTTGAGGSGTSSTCSSQTALPGCGTVFKLDPSGNLTVLYSFTGIPGDGALPNLVRLVMDAAGNLYGTTLEGGPGPCTGRNQILVGCGTVFKIGPSRQRNRAV